ncbi:MAG: SpoVR family protein [Bdellovibrionales bacterium]
MANLTPELERARQEICKIAEQVGLDFFPTIFEIVDYNTLNKIASYGGFPTRYPHWRWGMEYESLAKGYQYGLSKIYELVINTNPCYAYLMEGNEFLDQKLVMAHVYGHCDFFKNNQWFSQTDRKMMDTMANHAVRVRRYIDRYGIETVENFIDLMLSLENLIDRHSPYAKEKIKTKEEKPRLNPEAFSEERPQLTKEYMEEYLNPRNTVKAREEDVNHRRFPSEPQKDILHFLMQYAPLEDWQQDIISIIRDEAYYYAPQGMTKIMNEGWASYWHSKLMTERIMDDSEIIDFADRHSGTMAMSPGGFNPYKIGIELFRNIEYRWNKGQYGREWSECADIREKANWDKQTGLGRQKIFEVRRNFNDVTFIDEFLTEEFCVEHKMFVYKYNERTGQFEIDTRDFKKIKQQLLFQLTNFGQPIIQVIDGNFENRGELLLTHSYEGVDMQPDYMVATLENLQKVWSRPVNLVTVMDGEQKIYRHDGKEMQTFNLSTLPQGQEKDAPSDEDKP